MARGQLKSDGHKTTGTYEAATPPQGLKPVGVYLQDGLIRETKARLVAKGSSQGLVVDYFETFVETVVDYSIELCRSDSCVWLWTARKN